MLNDRPSRPRRDRAQASVGARRARRLVGAVALGAVVVACGSRDSAEPSPSNDALPPALDAAAPSAPGEPSRLPVGSPPPTTTPISIEPLSCGESSVTIAERLLIERRQRTAPPACVAAGGLPSGTPAGPPCWDRCADGRTFTDFVLDTDDPATEASTTPGAASVRYVARYVDDDGVESTVAETLWFEPAGDPPGVQLSEVTSTDLSAQEAALSSLLDEYFAALGTDDFATVAALLGPPWSSPAGERADLGRLVDEGLLAVEWNEGGTDPTAAVATAVEGWCRSGARCGAPDRLRIEVTPQHTVRAVASYDVDDRSFDTVFVAADGGDTIVGLPPRP